MAYLAQGAIKVGVNLATDEDPDWTNVPGVTVANGLGFGENRVDTTTFDTAPGTQASMSGPRSNVALTFTMHDEPDDDAQLAIHQASDDNQAMGFRLLRGSRAQEFSGVPVVSLAAPVNGVVTYSVSVTPDAKPSRSDPLSISGTPDEATVGDPYSFIPTVTGGSGARLFDVSPALPDGLALNATTGAITGTPEEAGEYEGDLTVTDDTGTATLPITLVTVDSTIVRLEPASADLFYVVAKNGAAVEVTRFQRGTGGSGGSDAGGSWPAFRPTGAGILPDFEATVAGNVIWLMDEIGACDLVAKNGAGTFMLSYHGLGTGGMASETITIDGEAVSHTVPARGEAFELRNSTTSISGGTTVSRDLSYLLGSGGILMRVNAASDTGVALVYYGMPMATGGGYSELHLSYDDIGYTAVDLGSGLADGDLTARSMRMRDPTTGYVVGSRGNLPVVSGFRKLRPDKSTSPLRTKTYMGEFADMASLVGVEVRLEWGVTAPGATTMTNLLDPSWTGGNWAAYTAVNGTVSATDGVLTMSSTSATTSNLRAHSAIPNVAEGERYVASVDFLSQANTTGTKEFFIGINTNGSTTGAARSVTLASTNVGMRVVTDFVANAVAPNQRFGIRNAGVSPLVTTFQNPIVRKVGA